MFTKHDYNKVKVGSNLIWTNHAKVWEFFMYSECICYNNVLNEILPFNQEVLCETMDYASFHIRKKLFYFIQGVTNTVFHYTVCKII